MIGFKNLILDTDKKACYIKNKEILLTKTEYNLLLFLISNLNKIFTRKELSKLVWSTKVSERAVDSTVSRLRKKLNGIDKNITTRIGFGYGFLE